jgi:hypothetical protein
MPSEIKSATMTAPSGTNRVIKKGIYRHAERACGNPSGRPQRARNSATLAAEEPASPERQAAIKALMFVAKHGGPTMLARIGVMRAINRREEGVTESNSTLSGDEVEAQATYHDAELPSPFRRATLPPLQRRQV